MCWSLDAVHFQLFNETLLGVFYNENLMRYNGEMIIESRKAEAIRLFIYSF